MGIKAALAFGTIIFSAFALTSATAAADVSDDLNFCARQSRSSERLACYDAIARTKKKASESRIDRQKQQIITPAIEPKAITQKPAPSFSGGYIGLTGGYDFSNTQAATSNVFSSLHGGKIGVVGGYNATSGQLMFGLEARGQYSFAKRQDRIGYDFSSYPFFPQFAGSLTCYTCTQADIDNYPLMSSSPILITNNWNSTTKYTRPWQFDLSFRSGVIINDDWLIFAKLGGGVEKSTVSFLSNASYTTCTPQYQKTQTGPQSLRFDMIGCSAPTTTRFSSNSITSYYNPIILIGAGVEKNFGPMFARAEGELTAHLWEGSGVYYTPSANLTFGYRF